VKRLILWLPLALFVAFLLAVAARLGAPDDPAIHSAMIGKPVPPFALAPALPGRPGLADIDLRAGKPRLLNVFASWCVPCIAETPQLLGLARQGVPIEAIAIRDRPQDVARFLKRWGDPYRAIGADPDSRLQLALGSSGVPETFVVDGHGIVRSQHIGPIMAGDVAAILAAYRNAQ
jgi:cytochrome c biogenesis protein CcmG/thiol:disulfide interchange protein DsbE